MNQRTRFLLALSISISIGCCRTLNAQTGVALTTAATGKLIDDDYSSAEHPIRSAARGDWIIADGMASVQHDDELYKKYANHGPIMIYEVPHSSADAVVEFMPTGCKTVVFTMDAAAGGHAFRVKLRTQGKGESGPPSQIVTYSEAPKDGKPEMIVLASEGVPKLKDGQWNRIEVGVAGDKATVKINGQSVDVRHKRIAQDKKIAKLGFAFGKLSIRDFQLDAR